MPFRFLEGIRVLDLSQYAPGPYASLILADLGADVIRIEPPGGEPMRKIGPLDADGVSAWYKVINQSKCVIELDLKSAAGKADLEALVSRADVFLESYRPGVLARLGFPDERLAALNPRLIRCSLSGWGEGGPYRLKGGHDINYMALFGALSLSGSAERPYAAFPMVADYSSGMHAALSILAAIIGRDRPGGSGTGCHIDCSIAESPLPWSQWALTASTRPGFEVARGGAFLTGGAAFYQIYRTADGRFVTLGALEEKFWQNFCEAVGHPEWTPRQWEKMPQTTLIGEVVRLFESKPLADWVALLGAVDCCFEPVHELAEMVDHPQTRERGFVVRHDGADPFIEVLFPARIDGAVEPARTAIARRRAGEIVTAWDGGKQRA
ncbi:MAG: CaiB/BaiF CoA transferase family protein [Alphaproteobacteria bacterium]